MQTAGHMARTSAVYFVSLAVQALRGIVLIPLLLHSIGPAGYGAYTLTLSWVSYGIIAAMLGLDSVIYQYFTPVQSAERGRRIYWTILSIASVWCLVLLALAAGGAALLQHGAHFRLILAAGCAAMGQVLWPLLLTPFRCEERNTRYMGSSTLFLLGDFLLTLTVATLTRDLLDIFEALATYHLGLAAVMFAVQARRLPLLRPSWEFLLPSVRFGLNGMFNQLTYAGYFVWDKTIISLAAGVAAIAGYSPGVALAGVTLPLVGMATFTLPTLLVRPSVQRRPSLQRTILRQALRQYAFIGVPAVVGIMLIAGPVLDRITSPALARTAAPIAMIAAAGVLAGGIGRFAMQALRTIGEDRWLLRAVSLHFVLFIAILLAGAAQAQRYTAFTAIGAVLAVNVSQAAFLYRRLGKVVPGVLTPSLFAWPLLAALAFTPLRLVFVPHTIIQIIAFVVAAAGIYLVVLLMLHRVGLRDVLRLVRGAMAAGPDLAGPSVEAVRPAAVLCCETNDGSLSAGMFYAAELGRRFEVHVALRPMPQGVDRDRLLQTLRRRGMHVHWQAGGGGVFHREAQRDLCCRLIDDLRPPVVFLGGDVHGFAALLARRASQLGADLVLFQANSSQTASAWASRAVVLIEDAELDIRRAVHDPARQRVIAVQHPCLRPAGRRISDELSLAPRPTPLISGEPQHEDILDILARHGLLRALAAESPVSSPRLEFARP